MKLIELDRPYLPENPPFKEAFIASVEWVADVMAKQATPDNIIPLSAHAMAITGGEFDDLEKQLDELTL